MFKAFGCCALALSSVTMFAQAGATGSMDHANMPGMQHPAPPAPAEEKATPIKDGGIFVKGWTATVDANAVKQGQSEKDSSFKAEGKGFHVMTGPALTYWDTNKKLTGDYTVSATFNEPMYMNRNDHPHPYGISIAGGDGTSLYCAAYGNGNFIVRGFGPDAFQMNGRRGEANAAVHKAEGPGKPVTQMIGVQVKGDSVSCMINGATVATYQKADVVTAGKLKSTDGYAGIRMAHNTDVMITNWKISK